MPAGEAGLQPGILKLRQHGAPAPPRVVVAPPQPVAQWAELRRRRDMVAELLPAAPAAAPASAHILLTAAASAGVAIALTPRGFAVGACSEMHGTTASLSLFHCPGKAVRCTATTSLSLFHCPAKASMEGRLKMRRQAAQSTRRKGGCSVSTPPRWRSSASLPPAAPCAPRAPAHAHRPPVAG